MKTTLLVFFFATLSVFLQAQETNPNYDQKLAEEMGADDYGMKNYTLVILKTGPNKTMDQASVSKTFAGHMNNINHLVAEGKLIVAGPMGKNEDNIRGIFILDVTDYEEAETLVATDPAVKAGLLEAVLYPWYGSAALPSYLDAADKIWKKKP
jgi:uncharacterized protein